MIQALIVGYAAFAALVIWILSRDPSAASNEEMADDLLAILDAAGSDRATLFDMSSGHATLFAATYPERSGR
jgi:pimeloyl-ACP methyl ester carboxylesterase